MLKPILIRTPFNFLALKNRRFLFNPTTNEFLLGTSLENGNSHAEDWGDANTVGAFDDTIRGWVCGRDPLYKHGIIHFAPGLYKHGIIHFAPGMSSGCHIHHYYTSMEIFVDNGAKKTTQVRGIGRGEIPLGDLAFNFKKNKRRDL